MVKGFLRHGTCVLSECLSWIQVDMTCLPSCSQLLLHPLYRLFPSCNHFLQLLSYLHFSSAPVSPLGIIKVSFYHQLWSEVLSLCLAFTPTNNIFTTQRTAVHFQSTAAQRNTGPCRRIRLKMDLKHPVWSFNNLQMCILLCRISFFSPDNKMEKKPAEVFMPGLC